LLNTYFKSATVHASLMAGIFPLTFKSVQIFYVNCIQITEQYDEDRQTNRRFSSGDCENKEHENLPCSIPQVMENAMKLIFTANNINSIAISEDDYIFAIQKNTDN
jgi:hypothetical protein